VNRNRAELLRPLIVGYSFRRHVLATHVLVAVVVAAACVSLRDIRASELLVVPAAFLFSNFFEYIFHRFVMHVRHGGPLAPVYDRHNMHHAYFHSDSMRIDDSREMRVVMFPAWAFAAMVAVTSPAYILTGLALGRNVGLLFLLTAVGYFLLYEWFHAAYHMVAHEKLSAIPFLRKGCIAHREHHDPKRMTQGNFNITFPIFDRVFRTSLVRGEPRPISASAAPRG
jgi:sterol desaturase/sphingolipid hydroxylase (fatty acid hydroxylase superfamily)